MTSPLRLGLNIDHVATLRNARGGELPDPVRAAKLAQETGLVDGITAHLREDRRHIQDEDIFRLVDEVHLPLNFEMAATEEMLAMAVKVKPHAVCIVPEKRAERTTEGGLDVCADEEGYADFITRLRPSNARVSLFIEAVQEQVDAALRVGAQVVEFHTGRYCHEFAAKNFHASDEELQKIANMADYAHKSGLEVHAGHGLSFDDVAPIAAILPIKELNIGHFLIGESVFTGLEMSLKTMRTLMDNARK